MPCPTVILAALAITAPTRYVLTNNASTGNYSGNFMWDFGADDCPPPENLTLDGNGFSSNKRLDVWIEANL